MLRSATVGAVALAGLLCRPALTQESRATAAIGSATEAGESHGGGEAAADTGRSRAWILLPHVFYTPETGLAGGAVVGFYPGGGLHARPSSVLSSVTVTARRQLMAELQPELYLRDGRVWISGNLRAMQYPDVFYGIGFATTEEMEEAFTSRSFALEVQARREVVRGSWLGLRAQLQAEDITEVEPEKLLASGAVTGAGGGTAVGLGAVATRDTRDRTIAPRTGVLAEARWTVFAPALGSDYRFGLLGLDARAYTPVATGVVALRARVDAAWGETPFTLLPKLGGSRLLRGYRDGRFRDDLAGVLEVEYRIPIAWRFGGVVFGGVGDVAAGIDELSPLAELKRAVGAGLRFRLNQAGVNVRIDWARSREASGLYIALGEAF